jgi:hypothetical protein
LNPDALGDGLSGKIKEIGRSGRIFEIEGATLSTPILSPDLLISLIFP